MRSPRSVYEASGQLNQDWFIATIFSTILGTMIAFAIGRYAFKGRSSSNLLIFLPMATPEIVLGASLLSLFLVFQINPGFWPTVHCPR
jgi:spermidine/putrescine transport system permease protein